MDVDRTQFEGMCRQQLALWQQVLRLQDWLITLKFWPAEALNGALARTNIDSYQKVATMILMYPEDMPSVEQHWPEGEAADYDMSIVHELIHVLLDDLVDDEHSRLKAEEQVCNILSRAIVHLYRNSPPTSPHPLSTCGGEVVQKATPPGHYM